MIDLYNIVDVEFENFFIRSPYNCRTLINERGDLLPFFVYKFFFGYIIKDVTERYNYNREVAL